MVEVKDRQLRLDDLHGRIPTIRESGIGEALFLIRGGTVKDERDKIETAIDRQFPSGHNIYVAEFEQLLNTCLILFGERGRREFVGLIGQALDDQGADIGDRRRWAALLGSI